MHPTACIIEIIIRVQYNCTPLFSLQQVVSKGYEKQVCAGHHNLRAKDKDVT